MKAKLEFVPAERTYGPATNSVRKILEGWSEVDWFAGPSGPPFRAAQRFAEHHARARLHLPDVYPASFEARLTRGGWSRFAELCSQVRAPGSWSWKDGPPKALTAHHTRTAGWTPAELMAPSNAPATRNSGAASQGTPPSPPRPGDLFWRFGESVLWTGLGMKVDFSPLAPERGKPAAWYVDYANMDTLFAIEWQLAQRSDDTSDNPFLPLLDVYAAGVLPFGITPDEFVLFVLDPAKE